MKFKPVTHVIFDLDGTLLDTEKVYEEILREIIRSHGVHLTNQSFDILRNKILGIKEPETVKIVINEYGLKTTPEDMLKEYLDKTNKALRGAPLMPGARKLIEHLYKFKIPMGLATSSTADAVEIKTGHLKELFSKLHHMVMASTDPEVKHGKPAPDIYLICASRFNPPAKPENCLVFEDAPNGAKGGVAAKMQVVAIPDPAVPRNLFPKETTQFLNSLEDFKPEDFGLPPYDGQCAANAK